MSYGSIGTGLGAPVGGATSNFGSTSSSFAPAAAGGSGFDFGSTIDANLALTGVGHILDGVGELAQSGIFGSGGTDYSSLTGYTPSTNTTTGSSTGTADPTGSSTGYTPPPSNGGSNDLSSFGFTSVGSALDGQNTGNANGTGGLQSFDQLWQGLGNQGVGGGLDEIMNQLNGLVNQLGQQAPAPAPQVDPVANLVNQANVDPQLRNAVTQVAQDPVGNKLLQGAVNDGLAGIQVANLPAGFFGQTLPATRQVQIAPMTLQGNDLVRTVAHELVHAATLGNGDSLREENLADQLGAQVQQRQTGFGPGYVLGGDAYNGLPQDNGIVNALRLLGITV